MARSRAALGALLPVVVLVPVLVAASPTAQAADRAGDPVPWGVEAVHDAASLQRTSGGDGVDVAVLDTGVDGDHPDLEGRVERCRNYTSEEVRVGSCNDVDGHGTHVAGTVAADGGADGEGIWGMAPGADVWAFKVCADDGSCRTDRIGNAIRDAARLGAEVVVLSLGGEPEPFVQGALNTSLQQDVLPVAAAGNAGPNLSTIKYPAADRLAVSVAAVGRQDRGEGHDVDNLVVPDFSSRGAPSDAFRERDNLTEVAAPGFGVRSTATGGGYVYLSGTSMAAPHVAGLAARLWGIVGDADGDGKVRDDVRAAIRERAASADVTRGTHAGTGYDPAVGIGLPRLEGPVARVEGPSVVVVGGTATYEASATGPVPVASYEWTLEGGGEVRAEGPRANVTVPTAGLRVLEVEVTDETGRKAWDSVPIRTHEPPRPRFQADPPVPLADEPFTLDASASSDDASIVSYAWDLDGDGETDRRGRVVSVHLTPHGPHDVRLAVVDDDGARNETTATVLANDRPRLTLDVPSTAPADEPVALRAEVTDEVGDAEVTWTLHDGAAATGTRVDHAFPRGTHTVEATAEDGYGVRTTAEASIQVGSPAWSLPDRQVPGPPPGAVLPALALAGLAASARRRR